MQIKYIVATIASLAVSSAIAGPVAEPAGNEVAQPAALEARAEPASENVKDLHSRYGAKLHDAYQRNYAGGKGTPIPTLQDLLKLKQMAETTPADALDKRGAYSYRYWWRSQGFRNGCQLFFPYSIYAHHFGYRLDNYYRCFNVFQDCDDDYDGCDCDYDYC
ncbi:hypothetical protein CLAFUW4_11519 [Fulvia fulva]|uniref:Putative effector 32 n=1 Tax=Passalora fulva TaxID=5499 RepID=A0A1P8YY09_PASFU|nr:uncharacterized protein CLAFUR5_10563 [Fulvia fulva]AQA29235.1 putative effector 32 [Fulvia fulva]KAK4619865.1 hypothetical protein CLAFUR4_11525 [Fulvia fulva]KAK4621066.1 hypothetical protein CLAFUR0_11533 [Fulvia fulva]UJO19814.1 hypothetical protein CLAFUR5_10563 [Fulvia fulva]WPV17468.1 hypothetical protein CLAFUW4_11519 [Fulvia fulva]